MRDRPSHTAGGVVARAREHATVAASPRLVERVREQRERAGLAVDVGEHRVDEAGLEPKPRRPGRALDRPAKLVAAHRAEQALVLGERRREARMVGATPVEVGPERDHERRRVVSRRSSRASTKRARARFVRAQREDLLELVDDEQRGRAGCERTLELRGRIRAGRHQHDGPFARSAERRDEPGADERRLPAPRCSDHGHEAAVEKPLEDGRHDLLASEEEVAVLGSEGHQPAVGAGGGAGRDRQTGRDERPAGGLVDALGEADLRRKPTVDRRGGRVVDQDLSPVGQLRELRRRGRRLSA